ncbi:hypothetical protein FJD20_24650, partial [Escherichia coli]|nr:hypothetical protein [Escherichia coli]
MFFFLFFSPLFLPSLFLPYDFFFLFPFFSPLLHSFFFFSPFLPSGWLFAPSLSSLPPLPLFLSLPSSLLLPSF